MAISIIEQLSPKLELFLQQHYQNKYLTPVFLTSRFEEQGIKLLYCCSHDDNGELEDLIVFHIDKRQIFVVNWLVEIKQGLAEEFEKEVFARYPSVKCVVWKLLPNKLNLAHSFTYLETVDMCISLPGTVEQYDKMLGSNSRKLYAKKTRRIERDLESIVIDEPCNEGNLYMVDLLTDWKDIQMKQRGESNTVSADFVKKILRQYGSVSYVIADGKVACVCLFYKIGKHVYYEQTAYDDKYNYYSLGRVATYLSILRFIENGMTHFHFLWKGADYKRHYAAQEIPLYVTRSYRHKRVEFAKDLMRTKARLFARMVARTSWGSSLRKWINLKIHG